MRRRIFPNLIGDVAQMEERQERIERVMQMLGVTPEFPFTFNINDGTWNRVRIGVIGADYGIEIVDNAGNSILLANGTIVANAIKAGTLDCSLITVTNLDAGSITVGYLSASKISGGTLNCNLMTVQNLTAAAITIGTFASPNDRFTDEAISGVKISQNTIYGNRIVANSINADRIQAGTITADRITAKTISADRIQDYSLGTGQLQSNGVNGDRIQDATITNAKIGNLSADKLTAGTIYVGYSGRPVAMYIGTGSDGDAKFYFQGNSRMWSDSSSRIGINSLGSPMYIYVGSSQRLVIPNSGQTSIYGGVWCEGNMNVTGDQRINGTLRMGGGIDFQSERNITNIDGLKGYNDIRYVLGNDSYWHSFANSGWGEHAWITASGGLDIDGNFHADGSKSFRIKHPENPDGQYIQYASVESPEVALTMRGRATLAHGRATITLPHHWELVTEETGLVTIQLTALDDCGGLYAPKASLTNKSFEVHELGGGVSDAEFCWAVTAIRKGYSDFKVEPSQDDVIEERVKSVITMETKEEEEKQTKITELRTFGKMSKAKAEFAVRDWKPEKRSAREMPKFKAIYKNLTGRNWQDKPNHGLTLNLEDRQPHHDEVQLYLGGEKL